MKRISVAFFVLVSLFCWSFTASAEFIMQEGTYVVAGRMLFDYESKTGDVYTDIDVVNVWTMEVTKPGNRYNAKFTTVFSAMDARPMVEAPLLGYRASFDFSLNELGNGNYKGTDGDLTFFLPDSAGGGIWDADNNASNGVTENFNSDWNGKFGADGVYTMSQNNANNFASWSVDSIVTFMNMEALPVTYTLETNNDLYWASYANMGTDGDAANDISFTLPANPNALVVPEPASMLLLGSGLAGLVGLRRKK